MEIRNAEPADLDAVCSLEKECEGADAWGRPLIAAGLAGTVPSVRYLLAVEGEGAIGYAVLSCIDDIAELQRIGVTENARRRGVATTLLESVFDAACRAGAQRILLEVRELNYPALAFYAAFGFVEIDRRPRYYRDGSAAVVMRVPVAQGCGW